MARRKSARDPFEVSLTDEQQKDLCVRLAFEIEEAVAARNAIVGDDQMLDQWHQLYEGGDRSITKDTPWPGAANLTSWLGTEKVDAYRARVVKTIFTEPIWVVNGWNEDNEKVAFVEQFHQWQAEAERLQTYLTKVVHNAFIEGTGVLEVSERPMLRKIRQRMRVLVQTNADGVPVGDIKTGKPMIQMGEDGSPIEAPNDAPPNTSTIINVDRTLKTRIGPQYRVISLKDFFLLPGHAQERKDLWGFAKRVWKRMPDLELMQTLGVYKNVDAMTDTDDRTTSPAMQREGQALASQSGPTAEKEIWELTYLDDLDNDGIQEWYVATIHLPTRTLLRLQKDDLGQSRYLLFIPFPRTRFLYGYSIIGHKLETIIDEHTMWRNMIADRSKLNVQKPMKRLIGSLWNPDAQPWGPNQIIPVRDMNEVAPMDVSDVPTSTMNREASVIAAAERVGGMNDVASGASPPEERTLGEVQTVFGQSMIRVEEVVHHLQESMEDLFNIRHEIWKRTLRENPAKIPNDMMAYFEGRGIEFPEGTVTADMLEGTFRGKPKGSVETADTQAMRQDFIGFLTAITQFSQSVPTFGILFQDPELGKQILSQAVRVFRWDNRQAIMDAINRATQKAQAQIAAQGPPGAAGAPGAGGLPLSPTTGKPALGVAHPPTGGAPAQAPGPNGMTSRMVPPTPGPQLPRGRPPTA